MAKLGRRKLLLALRNYSNEARKLIRDGHHRRVLRWNLRRGDETLRLEYDLTSESLVFDLGGYHGEWTQRILDRYGCAIHTFEPVDDLARAIRHRFQDEPRVVVHQFGLGAKNEDLEILLGNDASSLFPEAGVMSADRERIRVVEINEFMRQHDIPFVDLMKVNIEGAEFDLMEHLLETGSVCKFGDIQVQFHQFVPQSRSRAARIHRQLSATHTLTYRIPFVWENWTLRPHLRLTRDG